MAFIHTEDMIQWHSGEDRMHKLLHVPEQENPGSPFLTPGAAYLVSKAPLIALGALDEAGRPWVTVWGGEPGFARSLGSSIIGIRTIVDKRYDPVALALLKAKEDGEVSGEAVKDRMVAGLAIDLETRSRMKLYGHMVAGSIDQVNGDGEQNFAQAQLVVRIEESLGNCPKYLNKKRIFPRLPSPNIVSSTLPLPQAAIDLIAKADLFFIASSNHRRDMDANHRGGPVGFVRVLENDERGTALVYPEYSGNRLYQTLGNLQTTPRAGLVFPDFDTGDVLYITATTEVLIEKDAGALLARSNLAVRLLVESAIFVAKGLSFQAVPGQPSPYNPSVRYLRTEKAALAQANLVKAGNAILVRKQRITPTISRFRFRIETPTDNTKWKPGQYVALGFEQELDMGYSHMRDDDPKSLNDDYLRTFTVSSTPDHNEFEITIRKVGVVTSFLFRQNDRAGLNVPIKGFGGEFHIHQIEEETIGIVAGGIGITPFMAQFSSLDLAHVRLYWSIKLDDLDLVSEILAAHPRLASSTTIFVSGENQKRKPSEAVTSLADSIRAVERRRLTKEDLIAGSDNIESWYLCANTSLRKSLLEWLKGKRVFYEDFNY